jgi:3-isopropylmalate/(R)-2-methylmalate dehydratase small subunit
MKPFSTVEAVGVPLNLSDVDTDRIIPARFLRKPADGGYGQFLFHDLRFDGAGEPNANFPLNRPEYQQAHVLVADTNFGCGSSREQAVWALTDEDTGPTGGFRVVVAPSFGDIFRGNAIKNGLLPVILDAATCARIRQELEANPGSKVRVDLSAQTITLDSSGESYSFDVDSFDKHCLLNGLDTISLTLEWDGEISAYEADVNANQPWMVPD